MGHVPLFLDPKIATLNERFGKAFTENLHDEELKNKLNRVYFRTLETGLVREGPNVKAIGSGILSSASEMESSTSKVAAHREFIFEDMIKDDCDPSIVQPFYYVADSLDIFFKLVNDWLSSVDPPNKQTTS